MKPHSRSNGKCSRATPTRSRSCSIHCDSSNCGASDLRGGIDKLLALQGLVYDGSGMWPCTRRLQAGSFALPGEDAGSLELTRERFDWLVAGLLSQRLGVPRPQSITVV